MIVRRPIGRGADEKRVDGGASVEGLPLRPHNRFRRMFGKAACPFGLIALGLTTALGIGAPAHAAEATTVVAFRAGTSPVGSWKADSGFIMGGARTATTAAIDTSRVANPAPQSVYQSSRFQRKLTAIIPDLTPARDYTVRLHFAETFWNAPRQRVFDAAINGNRVLHDFDIYAAAGGKNIAVVKEYRAAADPSGSITIVLSATTDNASISGVDVLAAGPATPAAVSHAAPAKGFVAAAPGDSSDGWHNIFPLFAGNKPLPTHPRVHPQSQAMLDRLYHNENGHTLTGPALDDAQSTYYDAKPSDPVHVIHCLHKWGPQSRKTCAMEGEAVHVPDGSIPGDNIDHHLSILEPDGCTLDDFWQMQTDMSQPVLNASFGAKYNMCTEDGFVQDGGAGATAGGGSNRLGHSPLAELETGVIHHAIEVAVACNPHTYSVGQSTDAGGSNECSPGNAGPSIPYGAYVWSDIPPSELPANLDNATRMICTALNRYGGVVDDTIGPWNGMSLNALWNAAGNPAYVRWFHANSTNDKTDPTACFPGRDWMHHIHVLAF